MSEPTVSRELLDNTIAGVRRIFSDAEWDRASAEMHESGNSSWVGVVRIAIDALRATLAEREREIAELKKDHEAAESLADFHGPYTPREQVLHRRVQRAESDVARLQRREKQAQDYVYERERHIASVIGEREKFRKRAEHAEAALRALRQQIEALDPDGLAEFADGSITPWFTKESVLALFPPSESPK